jgi:DNA-binding IclR family transcriptional regulator
LWNPTGLERISWGRYRIGMRLWQVGSIARQARDLRDVALPFLQDLLDAIQGRTSSSMSYCARCRVGSSAAASHAL